LEKHDEFNELVSRLTTKTLKMNVKQDEHIDLPFKALIILKVFAWKKK